MTKTTHTATPDEATTTYNRRTALFGAAALVTVPALAQLAAAGPVVAQSEMPASSPATAVPAGRRMLGALEVSEIGLGCMSMVQGFYNPTPDPKDMVAVVRDAVDQGITFFDTAQVYGPFASEEIVGEALESVRDQVVIATKFGFGFQGNRASGRNSRPDNIRETVEASLGRLRTDRIDLLYMHRMDPSVPIEDIAGTVGELIAQGKVNHFGMSEVGPDTIRGAHAVQPVSAIQSEYSLLERIPEAAVLDVCEELGIGFVPWGPTGRAMLTDTLNEFSRFSDGDRRSEVPFFTPEAMEANMAVVRLVRQWADRKTATPVQISLAWLMAQKPFIVPIPGSTKRHHVAENFGAVNVKFTPEELQEFGSQLSGIPIVGNRSTDQATRDQ